MSQLFQELKRRNVFRVAVAYIAIAWLILQVSDIVFDNIAAPEWLMKALMFFMLIGFPVAILFAWAYELTPEGIKREHEVDRSTSITNETGQKLNRTIIAVLVAAVAFLLVDKFWLQDSPPPVAEGADKSVAVLPFVAMSNGENDEYFADGLTEEILNSLTRVPELLVTARTSAFHFKDQDIPIPEVAEQLGVAHIVEGSVRRDGDRLRVTAQLIRAADGFHLWSENYDRETEDTFGVQTDIAEKIATALGVFLDEDAEAAMKAAGMRNAEAYVALQKARELLNDAHNDYDMLPGLREANALIDQVVALEPQVSRAYMLHVDYYTHQLRDSFETLTEEERIEAEAGLKADFDAAVRYASSDEERLAASFDQALLTGNWESLTSLFDAYVETAACPNVNWGNQTTLEFGRADKLLKLAKLSIECNPRNPFGYWDAAQAFVWLGDPTTAIEFGEMGMANAPHATIRGALLRAYIAAGRFTDAQKFVDVGFTDPALQLEGRVMLAAARGDAERLPGLLDDLKRVRKNRHEVQLIYMARAGMREDTNRIAAFYDALPFGYLVLMGVPGECTCGAPWDLEVTPNYARLLEEAGYEWPPASPIKWPLKDW